MTDESNSVPATEQAVGERAVPLSEDTLDQVSAGGKFGDALDVLHHAVGTVVGVTFSSFGMREAHRLVQNQPRLMAESFKRLMS